MDKEKYSIIFSSLTGNTKKLADTIRAVLPAEDCDYFGAPKAEELHSEILYIGFWTDKGQRGQCNLGTTVKAERQKRFFYSGRRALAAARHIFRRSLSMLSSLLAQATPCSESICARAKCRSRYGIVI